ncbi:MAG: hypothetical protein WDO74_17935 [Pseudomonadota bacterium]
MSKSTLPIIFARGQNESIDPRVAPADVHAIAQNVRWRKDGRPEKKYGVTAVTTTGLSTQGYDTQPVNVLTSWNGNPVLSLGSSVRQMTALGWNEPYFDDDGELSHFGPGERDVVARDEQSYIGGVTSGSAGGMVLHVWDNGTSLFYAVKGVNGNTVVSPRFLFVGKNARCISTTNFIYVLSQNGTTLDIRVFNPTTLVISGATSPGTLDAVGSGFDACGRGSDFLVAYQSLVNQITVKLFTAVVAPALTQTRTLAIGALTGCKLGLASMVGGSIFLATMTTAGGLGYVTWNNALTAATGGAVIDTDANNSGQPGLVLDSATTAQVVWGGFVAATSSSYMRAARVDTTGVVLTVVGTFYGVAPVSKPFLGPVYSALDAEIDGGYVWIATHNANNNSDKWDSQRAYYLMKFHCNDTTPLRRQLHVPGVIPSAFGQIHLSDVLNLGNGTGFITPLLNAVRFGNLQNPTFGFDTVSFRSIFENVAMAARDANTAGRVLQFSGGSLFELNGTAEETGFSNFPVIQSITNGGGGTGNLSAGTYIYRAVYEWLDGQGRRHRSAPSDPVTTTAVANGSATLIMKPLVADAHALNASGSFVGRGTTLHVYRTLVNQSTFHRVTPNVGAPSGSIVGAATVSFADIMADSAAAGQEFIYTDGGVADNTLCPPHTFQTVCNGRLWVGGQLDRCVLTASKLLVDGEPTQFSDLDEFNVFLPQKCTGLASIDGTIVAFAEGRIYFISGDGPNDQGVGSFSPPVELPTDVGCVNWRSVVETSIGIFFQSKRGIFLLPRGFNTPLFVGADVESTLALRPYIVSSTLVTIPSGNPASFALGETTVRFVVGDDPYTPNTTVVLVYDLRTSGWSVDDESYSVLLSGTWSDTFITARKQSGALRLFAEASGTYSGPGFPSIGAADRYISTTLGTGDIRPFGLAGYGQFDSVVLVGEYRGPCFVNVTVRVDGASEDHVFNVQGSDYGDSTVYLDVTPKNKKGSAIQVTCSDLGNPNSSAVSEGVIVQGLFIDFALIGGTTRLPTARRA